jgi:hypothetical protein
MKNLIKSLFVGAFAVVMANANADPIGPPTCATCNGATYWLTYSGAALPDADPNNETFRITLSIDTSGMAAAFYALDGAAIKVSATPNLVSATLVSAPGNLAEWAIVAGGIDADGCSGNGGGFVCADWVGAGVGTPVGGLLTFVFDMTVANGTLFTGLSQASIKAHYVDVNGRKIGDLTSENISLQEGGGPPQEIPEPQTLALLGLGLLGLALVRRKRSA